MCLIYSISGNPLPQDDGDFGDYGDSASSINSTDGDEIQTDPIGDIFGDILEGIGTLVQEGVNLIADATTNDVSEISADLLLFLKALLI